MEVKSWWKSKLIWLGIVEVAGGVVEYLFALPPGTSVATIVTGIITIILRAITNQPVGR